MIRISRRPTGSDAMEGAWAEVLAAFGVEEGLVEGAPTVLMQPAHGKNVQGQQTLVDFVHPESCTYVFGPDNGHLEENVDYDHSIYIPQQMSNVTLWSHQAAAVVLYDRLVKNGNS